MKIQNKKTGFIIRAAMIAAIYTVLTLVSGGLGFGAVQLRLSEALTVLPAFTPAAIPGLFVGCLLSNIIGGAIPADVVFGSMATLVAAVLSRLVRRRRLLVPLPPVVLNVLVVPLVLKYGYGAPETVPWLMLTVGAGEAAVCFVAGLPLIAMLDKYKTAIGLK